MSSAEPPVRGASLLELGERAFLRLDGMVERLVPARFNPLQQTGAIAMTCLFVAIGSGVVELLWYSSSVHLAYDSVVAMHRAPLTAGLVRSLHRYSSDATMMFMLLHAVRLVFERRFTGPRWVAWVTGVLSVSVMGTVGWLGYWLVWDARGQLVAEGTARALDALPIFVDPLQRSLLVDSSINSLLFFVIFFFHMLVPLVLAVLLWLHVSRLSRPHWLTDKPMTAWALGALVVLSLVFPADVAPRAAMAQVAWSFSMDWWYLAPLVLTDRLGGYGLWGLFTVTGVALVVVPWVFAAGQRTSAASVVKNADSKRSYVLLPGPGDKLGCNACNSCYEDCPYDAIAMVPRTDGANFETQVQVLADKCVGCGICAGACDTAGVGLPWLDAVDMRHRVDDWLKAVPGTGIVLGCAESAAGALDVDDDGVCASLPNHRVALVPCAGWVNITLVQRALWRGASEVVLVSCPPGSCRYVEGAQLAEGRMAGLEGFRQLALGRDATLSLSPPAKPRVGPAWLWGVALAVGLSVVVAVGSQLPYATPQPAGSMLVVSFKHPGQVTENCRSLTDAELAARPVHMRPQQEVCDRRRHPVQLQVWVDGRPVTDRPVAPAGLWGDGNSVAVERIAVSTGPHEVAVTLVDGPGDGWSTEATLPFESGRQRVVVFDRLTGFTWH